jgi:hypothetical protein
VGVYSGGSNYNPSQVLRDESVRVFTQKIDKMVAEVGDQKYAEFSIGDIQSLVSWTRPDGSASELVWDASAIIESLGQFAKIHRQPRGYVYVDRDRALDANRRETAGVLAGGEYKRVPADKIALYLLRTKSAPGACASWWPQVRFPDGNYAFAFAV